MTFGRSTCCLVTLLTLPVALVAQQARYSFDDAQRFLKANCQACHQGTAAAGGFDIQQIASPGRHSIGSRALEHAGSARSERRDAAQRRPGSSRRSEGAVR